MTCKGYLDAGDRAVSCDETPPGRQHRCPTCREAHERRRLAVAQARHRARQRSQLTELQSDVAALREQVAALQSASDANGSERATLQGYVDGLIHRVSRLERWRRRRQWWKRTDPQLKG